MTNNEPTPGLLANTVALIGLIILAIVVIWGLLHLGSLSGNWFSSLFPSSNPAIVVSAPARVNSGEGFDVNWKYAPSTGGTYAVLYECKAGLIFGIVGSNGAVTNVPCGTAYTVGQATSSIYAVAQLNATSSISVPLSVVFMPNTSSAKQARGSATISVYAAAQPTVVAHLDEPSMTYTAPELTHPSTGSVSKDSKSSTSNYTAPADLSVRIISVNAGNPASVTFDISNVGGSSTGTYYFTAELPTTNGYSYSSPAQDSLAPGAHIVNTLTFSEVAANGGMVSIHVGQSGGANNFAQQYVGGNGASYTADYYAPSAPATYYAPTTNYNTGSGYYPTPGNYYSPSTVYQNIPDGYGPNPSYQTYQSYNPQTNYSYPYDAYSAQTNYGYGNDYSYPYQQYGYSY